jgi:hypothetical protein
MDSIQTRIEIEGDKRGKVLLSKERKIGLALMLTLKP